VQILGEREVAYIENCGAEDNAGVSRIITLEPPVLVMADGQTAPDTIDFHVRRRAQLPCSYTPGQRLYRHAARLPVKHFADRTSMHGVFMDILGVGVMITGESGLGKSELGLG
jgi:HPr kinase/phosphorylase